MHAILARRQIEKVTLSVTQAAQLLGIPKRTAYNYVTTGDLPAVRLGHRILVLRETVDAILSAGLVVAGKLAAGKSVLDPPKPPPTDDTPDQPQDW